jgi:spore germination cell wall hydrolase CwlJ-like protein
MKTLKIGIVSLLLLSSITLGTATHAHRLIQPAKTQDIECLASNIYHEARGEGLQGQIAVAQVTVNRVASGKFQSNVCKVVYANKQFSWTNSGTKRVKDTKAWQNAVAVAQAVLTQSIHLPDFKALYFHTRQVKPTWAKTKRVVAVINNHIFYS